MFVSEYASGEYAVSSDLKQGDLWLMKGDCLDRMKEIPDGSVDMVLADPPYGTVMCKWDSVIDMPLMWEQLRRVIKPSGAIVMTAANPFTSVLVCSNIKDFKYDWCWRKPKGTGHLNAKKMPMRDKEDIVVFYSSPCTYNPQMSEGTAYKARPGKSKVNGEDCYGNYKDEREDNAGKRYPKQVLDFAIVERDKQHPTQKPVPLMEYLIKTYTNESETVLDFTMGSGTTGVACANLSRKFIGIEMDPTYFDIATKRILSAKADKVATA